MIDDFLMGIYNEEIAVMFYDSNGKIRCVIKKNADNVWTDIDCWDLYVSANVNDIYKKKLLLIFLLQYSCAEEFKIEIHRRMQNIIDKKFANVFRPLRLETIDNK